MKMHPITLILFAGLGSSISFAQSGIVDCIEQRTINVPTIRGQVFDPNGIPIPGALVSVSSEIESEIQLRTDANGQFNGNLPPGKYTLKASYPGFEITRAKLNVGRDVSSVFHPTTLRVILALGSMGCPWVTTSNKEFKQLVHKRAAQN
jgi:hypothetical protein